MESKTIFELIFVVKGQSYSFKEYGTTQRDALLTLKENLQTIQEGIDKHLPEVQ